MECLGVMARPLYHRDAERATGVAGQLLSGFRERKPDEMSKVQQVRTAPFTAHLNASEQERTEPTRKPKTKKKTCTENELN
jgi:hypothetical protein